ncbi:MAG: type II toxin-antitoxin system RelE/ParE family toxin [Candidatus Thermoplasmatota archaeon]|nr:type II toxin-antitoxin system RelE/ParE family toxin [Candidatus Thermoplasmatota archaeon]
MEIFIHPRVKKYLDESGEKERLIKHLKKLADDPYNKRSGADVKRLKGKKHDMYRLRVGDYRFEYFIDEEKVWIDNAFKRGGGYR